MRACSVARWPGWISRTRRHVFAAPDWSVRVSFANLNDDVYDDIGRAVRAVARGYAQAYQLATGKTVNVARRAADGTVTKAR